MSFLQFIGAIASLISIPLTIYIYLKSKESRIAKAKNDIIRTISHQVGADRLLSLFEIKTIISSKLRTVKIRSTVITTDEIVEDLVNETISNPLINRYSKSKILENLKDIHSQAKLYETIDKINGSGTSENASDIFEQYIKDKDINIEEEIKSKKGNSKFDIVGVSTLFASISLILVLFIIFSMSDSVRFITWKHRIENFMINEDKLDIERTPLIFYSLLIGIVISFVARFIIFLIKKKRKI